MNYVIKHQDQWYAEPWGDKRGFTLVSSIVHARFFTEFELDDAEQIIHRLRGGGVAEIFRVRIDIEPFNLEEKHYGDQAT